LDGSIGQQLELSFSRSLHVFIKMVAENDDHFQFILKLFLDFGILFNILTT
jgi:hypothetical protein